LNWSIKGGVPRRRYCVAKPSIYHSSNSLIAFVNKTLRFNLFLTKRPRTGLNISAWICTIILAVLNAVSAASVVKSSLLPNLSIEEAFCAHSFVPKVPFEAERPSSTVF
jgi:hypothetical protein